MNKKPWRIVILVITIVCNCIGIIPIDASATEQNIVFQHGFQTTGYTTGNYTVEDTVLRSSLGQYYGSNGVDWNINLGIPSGGEKFRGLWRMPLNFTNLQNAVANGLDIKDAVVKIYISSVAATKGQLFQLYSVTDADGDWAAPGTGTRVAGKATYAQKKRHNLTSATYSINGTTTPDSNNSSFRPYLDNPSNWTSITGFDGGTYWAGGDALGNPGGGSYDAAPIATCYHAAGSTNPLEFIIPRETVLKWINGNGSGTPVNNGFLIRALNETTLGTQITAYAANLSSGHTVTSCYPTITIRCDKQTPEDIYLSHLDCTDQEGKAITEFGSTITSINVSARVANFTTSAVTPAFITALYDGTTNRIKAIMFNNTQTVSASGGSYIYTGVLNPAIAIGANDYVKAMVWDGLDSLKPYENIKARKYLTYSASTNNVQNYQTAATINSTVAGNWTYFYTNDATLSNFQPLTKDAATGNWTADSLSYTTSAGDIVSNGTKPIYYIYTISDDMKGKPLKISGTFTSTDTVNTLKVYKSADQDTGIIGTLDSSYIVRDSITASSGGTAFEAFIDATDAIKGNDIVFMAINGATPSKLNVTISAE